MLAKAHSTRSVRNSDCWPKRNVKRQKHTAYSTKTTMLARDMAIVLGNGHGLVASTLAMYATQHSDIAAYQP